MPLLAKQDCIRIAINHRKIMNKQLIYKGLKILFFLAGFPLLLMIMLITMAPMFNQEILGNHAANWMIGFCAIWVGLLIVQFLLTKFVAKKSETCRKIVLVAVASLSVLCVLLPSAIYDAAVSKKYADAYAQLYDTSDVKTFDALTGWHRDFTTKYKSEVYELLKDNYDIQQMYGLSHTYSEWYSHADSYDKEHGIGYKYGTIEKTQKLTEEKLVALQKYNAAKAELEAIEAEISAKKTAYDSAKAAYDADATAQNETAMNEAKSAYDQILADKDDDLVRLKGQRVDVTAYKEDLVRLLLTAIKDPQVLPDGLTIAGIHIDVSNILDMLKNYLQVDITEDTLCSLIPDVIYTGLGDQTVSTYKKAVEGSDSDLSLAKAQSFAFKAEYYPSVLAAGAMKYACYVCVALVVMSVFLTDYFARKEKEEGSQNE